MKGTFTRTDRFQIFGFLIGGMLPVLLVSVFEIFGARTQLIEDQATLSVLFIAIVGSLFGCFTPYLDKTLDDGSWPSIIVFSGQAALSIVFLHALVLYSGGPHASVFAGTYLYLPAVVGYTFGKGRNLYFCAFAMAISYLTLMFFPLLSRDVFDGIFLMGPLQPISSNLETGLIVSNEMATSQNFDWKIPNSARFVYSGIVMVQLAVTVFMSSRQGYEGKQTA